MKYIQILAVLLFCLIMSVSCNSKSVTVHELPIVTEGTSSYVLIRSDTGSQAEVDAALLILKYFKSCGITLPITTDWKTNPVSDYEIVVGKTTREGNEFYTVDRHSLGNDGFLVKAVGNKILVSGGSDKSTLSAAEYFLTEYCGYTGNLDENNSLTSLSVPSDLEYIKKQTYNITSVKINDVNLNGYKIVCDNSLEQTKNAELLQSAFYENCGIWLEIIKSAPIDGKAILFTEILPKAEKSFELQISDGAILLCSDTVNGIERGINFWIKENLTYGKGELEIKAYTKTLGDYIYYSEFGAVGDGVTDDMEAICAAHNYANKNNIKIKADDGAKYYIGGADKTAVIQTDTDFGNSEFIIDDTNVENRNSHIFSVTSKLKPYGIEIDKLTVNQENIGITFETDAFVTVFNDNLKQYIREGVNQNDGSSQIDIFLVSKDGAVNQNAPIIWDFDAITSATAYPVDETPLIITGGIFTTVANQAESAHTYYNRGINVSRSNVKISGLTHFITDELDQGAPYNGFITTINCANIEISDCILTGHKIYLTPADDGSMITMGTYDISFTRSIYVTVRNITQTNDINDNKYWGIYASNYCKQLIMENCRLSRFDAHAGVTNATIRGCEIGHHGINAIGFGTFILEDTTMYGSHMIYLRSDFGSTWNGDFIIKNCKFIPSNGKDISSVTLINGSYSGQHDFGYTCYMPTTITFENLYVDDSACTGDIYVFGNFNGKYNSLNYKEEFPYIKTKQVIIDNCKTAKGRSFQISSNKFMFDSVKLTEK